MTEVSETKHCKAVRTDDLLKISFSDLLTATDEVQTSTLHVLAILIRNTTMSPLNDKYHISLLNATRGLLIV